MHKPSKTFWLAILSSMMIFSGNVAAKDCYELSPYLEESEDDYYNLEETIKLKDEEEKALITFLKGVTGKWKGEGIYKECRGPDRAPRTLTSSATIKAKINAAASTKLDVVAEKRIVAKRIKRSDKFALPNLANTYNFHFANTHTLIFSEKYRRSNQLNVKPEEPKASSNTISIIEKIDNPDATPIPKKATKKPSSRLVETIYKVERQGKRLTITRSFYTNGVYVAEEKWSMQASRF